MRSVPDANGRLNMPFDAHMYGDPMLILERKQQAQARKDAQCGGCVKASTLFKGQPVCTIKFQTYGYRCQFFQLKDAK
jgi:hypothetical protein